MKYLACLIGIVAAIILVVDASPPSMRDVADKEGEMEGLIQQDMEDLAVEQGDVPSAENYVAELQKAGLPGQKEDEAKLQDIGENVEEQDDDAAMVEQVLSDQSVEAQGKWYRYYRHYYILYCRWRSYYYRLLRYYKIYRHHYIVYRNLYYRCRRQRG